MLADFTITIHSDPPRDVRVVVHDSVSALRGAATRYDRRIGHTKKNGEHSETLGVCHRFNMMNQPLCAIVRLAPPNVGIGVMSHEMAHAAVWLHELAHQFDEPLNCGNDEEFCWNLGELVRQTTIKFYELGIWE